MDEKQNNIVSRELDKHKKHTVCPTIAILIENRPCLSVKTPNAKAFGFPWTRPFSSGITINVSKA